MPHPSSNASASGANESAASLPDAAPRPAEPDDWTLSPSGRFVAYTRADHLLVVELATGRLVRRQPIPSDEVVSVALVFVEDELLVAQVGHPREQLVVLELASSAPARVEELGESSPSRQAFAVLPDVQDEGRGVPFVVDGANDAFVRFIAPVGDEKGPIELESRGLARGARSRARRCLRGSAARTSRTRGPSAVRSVCAAVGSGANSFERRGASRVRGRVLTSSDAHLDPHRPQRPARLAPGGGEGARWPSFTGPRRIPC